ncbi:MAG: efflux RND transporter periplasmic adaptor subunit [Pseudomonadota bacterium]
MKLSHQPIIRGIGLLALAVLVASCDDSGQSSEQSQATQPFPTVTVAQPLVKELIEWDEFTGRFEAIEYVEIRPRVSGHVRQIEFTDGELVEAGDPLFVIDQRPFENVVAESRARLDSAAATLELANIERARVERLRDSPALSQQQLDLRIQEAAGAQAEREAARAALAQAQLDLEFTSVQSPIAGRTSDARVDIGNLVDENSLLTTIVSLDPIFFVFDMSERNFLAYQRAVLSGELVSTRDDTTVVDVRLVDEETWDREGQMNFVDNVVDQGTATVRARARVPNPDFLILPGQFGRLRLPGSPLYPAILIPDEAVGTDQDRKFVYVVNDEQQIEQRIIRPGPREFGLRIVRRGLEAEDRVVIEGIAKVRPGMTVNIDEASVEIPERYTEEAAMLDQREAG